MTRILVVEDSASVREELALMLSLEGFEVETALHGQAGLEALRAGTFDLVICDMMMPHLDGLEMVRRLRHEGQHTNLPVLFLTARADRDSMRQGMGAGADDYLTKPFTAEDLLLAVRTHLARSQHRQQESTARLDELCGQLSASLPHELRTPLNVILGFAEMLAEAPEDAPAAQARTWAGHILEAARRLTRLTENFLLSAQLELLERTPVVTYAAESLVALDALAQDVATDVATSFGRHGDLVCSLSPLHVALETNTVRKILGEILDNAFKFSPPGSRVIVEASGNGAEAVITVADGGIGMAPEMVQRIGIFRQFERARREQQGLGLGLGLALRLLDLAGGGATIESVVGSGTRVSLRFPAAAGAGAHAAAAPDAPETPSDR